MHLGCQIKKCGLTSGSIVALRLKGCTLGALLVHRMAVCAAADLDRIQRTAVFAGAVIGTLIDVAADVVIRMMFVHFSSSQKSSSCLYASGWISPTSILPRPSSDIHF